MKRKGEGPTYMERHVAYFGVIELQARVKFTHYFQCRVFSCKYFKITIPIYSLKSQVVLKRIILQENYMTKPCFSVRKQFRLRYFIDGTVLLL